jgi:hypothetical protein
MACTYKPAIRQEIVHNTVDKVPEPHFRLDRLQGFLLFQVEEREGKKILLYKIVLRDWIWGIDLMQV